MPCGYCVKIIAALLAATMVWTSVGCTSVMAASPATADRLTLGAVTGNHTLSGRTLPVIIGPTVSANAESTVTVNTRTTVFLPKKTVVNAEKKTYTYEGFSMEIGEHYTRNFGIYAFTFAVIGIYMLTK